MSLKGFHIIFIFFAVLCTVGFCVWTNMNLETARELNAVAIGQASGFIAAILVVYGVWFVVKKSKTIIL